MTLLHLYLCTIQVTIQGALLRTLYRLLCWQTFISDVTPEGHGCLWHTAPEGTLRTDSVVSSDVNKLPAATSSISYIVE